MTKCKDCPFAEGCQRTPKTYSLARASLMCGAIAAPWVGAIYLLWRFL